MYHFIEGLPPDVLGIEAEGKVTHEDYRDRLIPKAEAMMANGPIKALVVIRNDLPDYSLEAMWDDQVFGLKHWRDVTRIALVTDHGWMKGVAAFFRPFFPAEMRVFRLGEVEAAKDWICSASTARPAT